MKRVISILLALMLLSLTAVVPFAAEPGAGEAAAEEPAAGEPAVEATAGPVNHLTAKWSASVFAGKLEETEEDGATVITYTPADPQSWMAPTIDIFADLKALLGERKGMNVILSYEIRGVFTGEPSGNAHNIIRAINPKNGGFSFPPDQAGNWDGEGNSWQDLYGDVAEGDLSFSIDGGNNNMAFLAPEYTDLSSGDWMLFETEPLYVSAYDLDGNLFGGMLLTVDALSYGNLTGLQIRNTAIYDYDEIKPTKAPTAEPTEAPEMTPAPATEGPADDPGNKNTGAPADNGSSADPAATGSGTSDTKSYGPNVGLIIGIVCAAAVVVAAIAAVIMKKKKAK